MCLSVGSQGRLGPALLTALTRHWKTAFSFSPSTTASKEASSVLSTSM